MEHQEDKENNTEPVTVEVIPKHESRVIIGKRVSKTADYDHGWVENIKEIPFDKPCVFTIGGNGTKNPRFANWTVKQLQDIIGFVRDIDDFKDIDFYGVWYDFGANHEFEKRSDMTPRDLLKYQSSNDKIARALMFEKYKRTLIVPSKYKNENINQDTLNPQYIKQIFDCLILPRISENGVKLDTKTAMKRIRNLTVFAHCHGAYVFLKLEEMMQDKMKELGYTADERNIIQKQLFCVAYAPLTPVGINK